MKYAINTLNIELYKQLEAIRVVNRYSAHPEYQGSSESFEQNVSELHSAIERLQSSEQAESPATAGNSDYAAAERVYREWCQWSNISVEKLAFVPWLERRLNSAKAPNCA